MREGNFFLGGGGGAGGEHACGFLFNFSKVTENAIITITIKTGNNSIIEQIQKKSSKNYAEFTHQIKKVFHFVWKEIRNF